MELRNRKTPRLVRVFYVLVFTLITSLTFAQVHWKHLSSKAGDLPAPFPATQQTASLVLDVDRDGINDFVITERTKAPSAVWYRRKANGWDRYVIDDQPLEVEAGGAACDIDGDGDPDLIFGGDWRSNQVWWWENPYPNYDPEIPWKRHVIKDSGKTMHHDELCADVDGDGKPEVVFWNQGAQRLFLAKIPPDPRHTGPWPLTTIFESKSKPEGLALANIDGDGQPDIVGGGRWFKYEGGLRFAPHVIDDAETGSRVAVGQLVKGGRPEVVFVLGDGIGRLKWYEWNGNRWQGHDLLGHDVIHGHSLRIADIDGDGNLDIFCAEMGKWTEKATEPDNPSARMWIFYGDGKGHFKKDLVASGFGNHESRVADLDGDGRLDILGKPYNWDTPRIDVWLNEGVRAAQAK